MDPLWIENLREAEHALSDETRPLRDRLVEAGSKLEENLSTAENLDHHEILTRVLTSLQYVYEHPGLEAIVVMPVVVDAVRALVVDVAGDPLELATDMPLGERSDALCRAVAEATGAAVCDGSPDGAVPDVAVEEEAAATTAALAEAALEAEDVAPEAAGSGDGGAAEAEIEEIEAEVWEIGPDGHFVPVNTDFEEAIVRDYVVESREALEEAEAALLDLEANPDNEDAVGSVFRSFHTVKGTSGFLGFSPIEKVCHLAENVFSRIRDGEIACSGFYADLALQSADLIREMIDSVEDALGGELTHKPAEFDRLMAVLSDPQGRADELGSQASSAAGGPDSETIRVGDLLVGAGLVDREMVERVAAEGDGGHIGDALVARGIISAEEMQSVLNDQKVRRAGTNKESSVRVATDRLDNLVALVGELVVAQAMIAQDDNVRRDDNDLFRKVEHSGKIVRDLQDLSMAMRMVPLRGTFQKMARVARDVAAKQGKTVMFSMKGEDTEIDRNMVDLVADPLVHMVRNAVDHGIETGDERTAKGKASYGTVELIAFHAGGNVVIELRDDGKGLNREALLRKAVQNGLVREGQELSDHEVWNLIFEPGFSTAAQVTDVSGRGVGMDVVRKNIEQLNGKIEIHTTEGKGSTFIFRLPLTLAITDGMLIRAAGERYLIPTTSISLSFRPEQEQIVSVQGRGEMVMLRGELIPLFRLHRLFHPELDDVDPTQALIMVLDDGNNRFALLVDELLGQQQVVAKSLGKLLGKVLGVSGGAILGDGRVGLILDLGELLLLARNGDMAVPGTGAAGAAEAS